MKKTLTLLKIGGNIIEDEAAFRQTMHIFARWENLKLLVHGGGRRADNICQQLGITPLMQNGRRITDAPTLEVVIMVYAGLVNKNIVATLQAEHCNAIGLTGADLNSIRAHKRPVQDIDYGFAGDIDAVDAQAIRQLLDMGATPVFCAITHDRQGQLLNTNADTIAAILATSLAEEYAVQLLYCFEKKGVLLDPADDDSVIAEMDIISYRAYKKQGIISGGMLPKLDNAFAAIEQGVKSVTIGNMEALAKGAGTKLH